MSDARQPGRVTFLIEQARATALRDAAMTVREYANERNLKLPFPTPSEDITAALRVAAQRVEALIDTPSRINGEDPL